MKCYASGLRLLNGTFFIPSLPPINFHIARFVIVVIRTMIIVLLLLMMILVVRLIPV